MKNYYWSIESWGSDYAPENADEIIDQANELIDAYAETHDDPDTIAAYSEQLWDRYCTTGSLADDDEEPTMKTNTYNRYSYTELLEKATAPDAEQIDIDTLGAWFADYGNDYWNGEYYDADGSRLFPIYSVPDEFGDVKITGYEFR